MFPDDGCFVKRLSEYIFRILQQVLDARIGAEGGGGTHAAQPVGRGIQPCLEASHQAGKVSTLCAVKCMQFVHHQILERFRFIELPQIAVLMPDEHIVQHLVVGE